MANKTVYPYGTGGSLPSSIGLINDLKTGGVDKALTAEQGKVIGDILLVEKQYPSDDMDSLSAYDDKSFKANSAQIGKALSSVQTTTENGTRNYRIPVSGAHSVTYRKYSSGYEYGCLFLNAQDVVVQGIVSVSTDPAMRIVGVPEGAAYFIWSYFPSTVSDADERICTVSFIKTDELNARVDDAEKAIEDISEGKRANSLETGISLDMEGGHPNSSGSFVDTSNYVTTEAIFGAFFIKFAEGWKMYEAHLYDRKGNMVSYQHIHPDVYHQTARGDRLFMSTDNMVPDYGMRITICKTDQSAIAEGEQPIVNFVLLSESGLHRWIPSDLPNYDKALRRVNYLEHLRWVPLAKVPNGYPDSSSASATNVANTYFDLAGQLAVGVPYSDVAGTRTYVPNNVSLRTFMTAVKNRRSLLYTEELHKNTSKYGKTYKSGHRRAYYGTVCCGLTAWVMGMDTMYLAGDYGSNNVPGLSTVAYNSVDDLRPLDLIWQDGHIQIISDIWKDEFGNVKYIGWAEMSTPYPYRGLLTPELFNSRLASISGTVHRWDGWANLPEPDDSEYSQYLLGQTRKEPEWSGDIMCFAGDYAAFVEGDIIHLNARRNSVYTGVELYKDDVLLQTIDITGLPADTIVTPNTEDWVDVNLTPLNLAYGKYKARLTNGTNTTDYTYFEIIGVSMSATKSGNTVTIAFGSSNGTPVSVEQVKENGFPNSPNSKMHEITAEEVSAGTMTLNWAYNSTYKYLLMLVRGDYGTVAKRISHPSA